MNDDLISRQTAINALTHKWDGMVTSVFDVIKELPSVQQCDTCRYAGLEWDEEPCDSCTRGGETNHYKPSVQPEKMQLSKEDATKDATFDCISRQMARDALNQLSRDNFSLGDWFQTYLTALIAADDAIQSLPSVQPQRWIPVTERLPEHSGFYIVTAIVTDDGGKLVGLRWFSQEHGWKFGKNPLAWMPLPEPMRETE